MTGSGGSGSRAGGGGGGRSWGTHTKWGGGGSNTEHGTIYASYMYFGYVSFCKGTSVWVGVKKTRRPCILGDAPIFRALDLSGQEQSMTHMSLWYEDGGHCSFVIAPSDSCVFCCCFGGLQSALAC